MWHWIADAFGALARLLERHEEKQVFLVGISTGALVLIVAVYVFELLQKQILKPDQFAFRALSRCGILGRNFKRLHRAARNERRISRVALIVPALRLKRRRDEYLLISCFVMYYIGVPIVTLLQLLAFPSKWPMILIIAWLNLQVFSGIWIPSGDAIAAKEHGENNIGSWSIILVAASCFYCGFALPICLFVGYLWGAFAFVLMEIIFLVTLLPPLMWHPVRRANGYHKEKESADSPGYLWLPVVATSTLIPLQWLARYFVQRLQTPMIIIFAGQDEVVDNIETRSILPAADYIDEHELSHGDWNPQNQASMLRILSAWLEKSYAQA
jgi:hypothetical protein